MNPTQATKLALVLLLFTIPAFAQRGPWQFGGNSASSGSTASANMIDPTQSPYNVKASGGRWGVDGSVTNTQNQLSSAAQNCAVSDVGKAVTVVNSSTGAFAVPTASVTTVTGCNGNAWTLSGNATQTIAGTARWAVVWDAGPGLASAAAAAAPSGNTSGQIIAVPCGLMGFSVQPFPFANQNIGARNAVEGCNTTDGSAFIALPTMQGVSAAFATGQTGGTNPMSLQGWGTQTKLENIFLTSLGGALASSGGNVISGFYIVKNVFIQAYSVGASASLIQGASGESEFDRLNLQNNFSAGDVVMQGQGVNGLSNSIIAYNNNQAGAIQCAGGAFCTLSADYTIGNQGSVVSSSGAVLTITGSDLTCTEGASLLGCLYDNGNASTWYLFGDLISQLTASWYAIDITNGGSVVDISGTQLSSNTAGYNVGGSGILNDRVGNTFSSTLSQFTGKYVPVAGGSTANQTTSATTNFGTTLSAQTIVSSVIATSGLNIEIGARQVAIGTGSCSGNGTVVPTLAWTAPGGTSETLAMNTLTVTGVGAVDSGATQKQSVSITAKIGTTITYTTTSTAPTGCTTVPTYAVDASNL